jgi:hypothetical protein
LICTRYLSGLARTPAPELMSKKSILNKKIIRKTKPSLLPEYIERSSIPSSIHEVFIGSGVLCHGSPCPFCQYRHEKDNQSQCGGGLRLYNVGTTAEQSNLRRSSVLEESPSMSSSASAFFDPSWPLLTSTCLETPSDSR